MLLPHVLNILQSIGHTHDDVQNFLRAESLVGYSPVADDFFQRRAGFPKDQFQFFTTGANIASVGHSPSDKRCKIPRVGVFDSLPNPFSVHFLVFGSDGEVIQFTSLSGLLMYQFGGIAGER